MIDTKIDMNKIKFPIGSKKTAELLDRHQVTVNKHLKKLDCPRAGNYYIVYKNTFLHLIKNIGTSKKKKNFSKNP